MKKIFVKTLFAALMLAMSGWAAAALTEAEAEAAVLSGIDGGWSSAQIIEMLVEQGLTLEQAANAAVTASSGDRQVDLAKAAVCAATDVPQAERVGNVALELVGAGNAFEEIEGAIENYETTGCTDYAERRAPTSYAPRSTGSTGGINVDVPGGTPGRPPGGTRPPVGSPSPSS